MTARRDIPADTQAALEASASPEALLAFLMIEHPELPTPVRVVSDVFDYRWGGDLYQGVVFGFALLSDQDSPPETELTLPNVSKEVSDALDRTNAPATVRLDLISTGDFNRQDPRQPLGTPVPIYSFSHFDLVDVRADAVELRGRVVLHDYATEPYGLRGTQERLPGLFR